MKGKKDQGARGGIRTGDDGEVEVRRGKKRTRRFDEDGKVKKRERGKKERIALVYRSRSRTTLSHPRLEKEESRGRRRIEMVGKDDNIVTRDANLVGTLMDDPTTMKLDRRILP